MIAFFDIIGIIGLILIVTAVVLKKRKTQAIFFVFGGIFLAIYSILIKNYIFIVLQIVFVAASLYELWEFKR